jgi:hypothetical protein
MLRTMAAVLAAGLLGWLGVAEAGGQTTALPPVPIPLVPAVPAPPADAAPKPPPPPPPDAPAAILIPNPVPPPPPAVLDPTGPRCDVWDGPAPGLFGAVEISALAPHFTDHLVGTVPIAGGTDVFHTPPASLGWTGAPRFELGYRLPDNAGEFLVSYRSIVADNNGVQPNFDALGDAQLRSRLNFNDVDLDYGWRLVGPGSPWDVAWRAGVRVAAVYYDTQAVGQVVEQRSTNNFVGAGPHAGLDVWRRLDGTGLSAFGRLEGAVVIGDISQSFEEVANLPGGGTVGGASRGDQVQGVPVFSFQLGLGFTPQDRDHLRLAFGYQFERWWYIGAANGSAGDLTTQGLFFRAEFNY